MIVNLNDDKIV